MKTAAKSTAPAPRRFLIADDHAILRAGLRQILAEEYPGACFAEAADSRAALSAALDGEWSLVLMDISMPGRGGLEVLKELRAQRPRLPVLILSMHPEEQFAVRALKSGAAGYLTKASAAEELVQAVARILAGGRYVSASLAERLAATLGGAGEGLPHETLSDREFQILRLLAAGRAVKEIADELTLSVNTVSTYRARVLEKLALQTNADLTRYALTHGLVE